MPISAKNQPPSTIGLVPEIAPARSPEIKTPIAKRPEPPMVRMKNPETGETALVSAPNVRDMVRHNKWVIVQEKSDEKHEGAASAEGEDKVEDTAPEYDMETELGKLRARYFDLTGNQPDGRWGKKALDREIEAVLEKLTRSYEESSQEGAE